MTGKSCKNKISLYECCEQIVLTWRQKDSLEHAQQLYPRVTNILLPDAAFMIGPLQESTTWSLPGQQRDLLLLLRDDQGWTRQRKRTLFNFAF